jgi:hypothetical protein
VYAGEYRRHLRVDVDDWFLSTGTRGESPGTGNPSSFRLSRLEAQAVAAKQMALRSAYPAAQAFTLDIALNACGAVTGTDPCEPAST